jgi:putrescine---pyruvate transaminase
VANAAVRGDQALDRLRLHHAQIPGVGDIRGRGLLLGLEFVSNADTKEPFPAAENVGIRVREAARRRGLLLRASHWMAVLAPPLTTTADELDEMLDIFGEALAEVLSPLTATPQPLRM